MKDFPLKNRLLANRIAASIISQNWMEPEYVDNAVDSGRGNSDYGVDGIRYMMGLDFGYKNDGAAVSIIHRDKQTGAVVVDYIDVFYPGKSDIWKNGRYPNSNRIFKTEDSVPMYGFADIILELCKRFNIAKGWFDQFNGYGLLDFLKERGLKQFEVRATNVKSNMKMFDKLATLLEKGLLRLPDNKNLIRELKSLKIYGEESDVEAPREPGFHDDMSDSVARAVWLLYGFSNKKPSHIKEETYNRRKTDSQRTKSYVEDKDDLKDTKYDSDLSLD